MKDYALGFSMYAYITYNEAPKLKVALEEMFARTALGIVQEGRSFTEVATTTRFKLNVPLMATLLFLDTNRRFDDGGYAEPDFWVLKKFPNFSSTELRLNSDTLTAWRVPEATPKSLAEMSEICWQTLPTTRLMDSCKPPSPLSR